jgi:hypothetical protein
LEVIGLTGAWRECDFNKPKKEIIETAAPIFDVKK